jgi:hypothetical protein
MRLWEKLALLSKGRALWGDDTSVTTAKNTDNNKNNFSSAELAKSVLLQ